MMTAIYCFSGSGHSRAVANALASALGEPVTEITAAPPIASADTAVVVFPVYCQNVPPPVRQFLRALPAGKVALVATYGGISYGNVLWEASRLLRGVTIAAAAIPTGHTYLGGAPEFDPASLQTVLDQLRESRPVVLKKERKHLFANFFPAWRSRMGVRLTRNANCTSCGHCQAVCPMGAISGDGINRKCIRCLRCVSECPRSALDVRIRPVLMRYLLKKDANQSVHASRKSTKG